MSVGGNDAGRARPGAGSGGFRGDNLSQVTASPGLEDDENRRRWQLGETPEDRGPYLIELNVLYVDGLVGAATALVHLFHHALLPAGESAGQAPWSLMKITKNYFRCELKLAEWKALIAADEKQAAERAQREIPPLSDEPYPDDYSYRIIYKLWPDFPIQTEITRSVATIKADAALRTFDAAGSRITWAVIDSGVDASHPHFGVEGDHTVRDPLVGNLHRCFLPVGGRQLDDPDEGVVDGPALTTQERERRLREHRENALQDPLGHGTHVAGIIAGRVVTGVRIAVLEKRQRIVPGDQDENLPKLRNSTRVRVIRNECEQRRFHGIAPACRIVSLRALDEKGGGRSSNIVRALEYVRERLNDNPKIMRVHGVNLSVGYEFDAEMFACGQSPLCAEVNRLVQSGVVVVTAAGNTGYSTLSANGRVTKVGLSSTINDPGNAEQAITVGSTHRQSPHTFGVSYFSSKGPTGDGRLKPDLVAPGERIISCAAGSRKAEALRLLEPSPGVDADPAPDEGSGVSLEDALDALAGGSHPAYYVEDSGTSMAAPHVSGAVAAFLSIRREFIGRPLEVKRIFLENAVPLGREPYFEGRGLLDLMKAVQSV